MGIDVLWTIPTRGDGRAGSPARWTRGDWNPELRFAPGITDVRSGRFTYADYLVQVARAAEAGGFGGLVIPHDVQGEESWVIASALAREVPRLAIVPEFPPDFGSAVYIAKLALTFQRYFSDRLGWKIALDRPDAIPRAGELLAVADGVWNSAPFSYDGTFFSVEGGGFFAPTLPELKAYRLERRRFPIVYLSGTGDEALELSAQHADVHLFDGLRPAELADAVDRHRALAGRYGRRVRYGLRLAIVAREYESEALARAQRLWSDVHPGDRRGFGFHRIDDLLWDGFGELGHAAPFGLVGSYRDVADRLAAYAEMGFTTFVLDALPRLEQAYRLAENLFPQLAARAQRADAVNA